MRPSSPRGMAIFISVITTLLSCIVMLIAWGLSSTVGIIVIVASTVPILIITFISVQYLLNSFIFDKINPIYKTIHNLNISDSDLKQELQEKDILNEVNREVVYWANTKIREIDQLKEMANFRKEFLGNVSHELKTPIFNMQGYILTLLDGGLEDGSINRLYLERAERSINRLISIVEDLESISKLESKEQKIKLETLDIVKLVGEVFEAQEMRSKKTNITLRFDKSYEKPIWVLADRKLIYQLLVNLVVNSIKYGKPKGHTWVSFSDMHDLVLIEVSDDGIGIPKKDLPRIFERFYRVEKSRSIDQGGSGLGLAIVKHIIEAHGQSINVRSGIEEGTTFAFTLKKVLPLKEKGPLELLMP